MRCPRRKVRGRESPQSRIFPHTLSQLLPPPLFFSMKTLLALALALAVAAILLSTAYQVQAQVVGQRVRVKERSGAINTGIVVEKSETALTIGLDGISGAVYRVSFTDIQALAISLGEQSYAKPGLLIGGLAGAAAWALICEGCSARGFFGGGILISALTAGLGARAGNLVKKERWTFFLVPGQGQAASLVAPLVGVRPTGQPVVGVRLTF